jgi:hypothetical protein
VQGLEITRLGQQFQADRSCSLPLCPSILIPGFDLGVSQIQFGGQFLTILHAQIFLFLEAAL